MRGSRERGFRTEPLVATTRDIIKRSKGTNMDTQRLSNFVEQIWEDAAVPALIEYIGIPNKSPAFDPDWEQHGHMRDAVVLMERWARAHLPEGGSLEIVQLPGRTPLMYMDIP